MKTPVIRFLIFFSFIALVLAPALAQKGGGAWKNSDNIPVDPSVRMGTLSNGMKYYIRKNTEPENRAELRLAVNAGSILETDEQQGLAHFAEHMAFNGTEHFEKQELIDYLESVGTKFGPHLNAYTSFDETVYMIQIPTDDEEIMKKGFLILEDWAHGISFEDEEIDKERGVVIEEWRLRQGAQNRIMQKTFPIILKGSQYANRLPIGKKDILETFKYETIKDFYKTWYRPELMALVAVGDFDVDNIEKLIKENFSKIPATQNGKERTSFDVPSHKETLVAIGTDKEVPMSSVQILYKKPPSTDRTVEDYRGYLKEELLTNMISNRLDELKEQADPPFSFSYCFMGNFIRNMNAFGAVAIVPPTGIERGLESLATELERARRHGFMESELKRAKESMLKDLESDFQNKENLESRMLAREYVSNFLEEEPMPGIENEYALAKHFMDGITLEEVTEVMNKAISDENIVIVINAPEKEGIDVPSEEETLNLFKAVKKSDITPYEDKVDDGPLVSTPPEGGKVSDERPVPAYDAVEWQLSNGARVILKQTDFETDKIHFRGFSVGGSSRYPQADYMAARHSSGIINNSGVGRFDNSALNKKLAGKIVSLRPYISELHEGFYGDCNPDDFETMLQLVYLYFTKPRKDSDSFESYKSRMKGFLATMSASPERAFRDTFNYVMGSYHPRRMPLTPGEYDKIDFDRAFEIYYDRFNDASDFTFVLVGNIDPAKAKPMVAKWLGGIPGYDREENWKDLGIHPPEGVVERMVEKGVEPKSLVNIAFSGEIEYDSKQIHAMNSMCNVLRIMLRESLREDKGGTYFVRANPDVDKLPEARYTITLGFGCAPENVQELTETTFQKIKELQENGPSEKNMTKVKETQRRELETDMKNNRFWIDHLQKVYRNGEEHTPVAEKKKLIEELTAEQVKEAANKYLDAKNYVKVVLVPEETE